MLAELDALYELGWRGTVFIVDDNFIGNKKNVRHLLPELADWQKRHDYPFTFLTEASVNLADDEPLLESMRQSGFRRVFLGIETPVEESLKEAQKSQNRGNLLDSVKKIQSYGMEVMAGFIVGFDNDPEDILSARSNSFARARFRWRWLEYSRRFLILNYGGGWKRRDVCWVKARATIQTAPSTLCRRWIRRG